MRPDHFLMGGIAPPVEGVVNFFAYFHGPVIAFDQIAEALHRITHLTFTVEHGATAMAEIGVRAV
jgi:hypothetical protein